MLCINNNNNNNNKNNNNGVKICALKVVHDCVYLRLKHDGVFITYIVVVSDGYITDSNVINVNPE